MRNIDDEKNGKYILTIVTQEHDADCVGIRDIESNVYDTTDEIRDRIMSVVTDITSNERKIDQVKDRTKVIDDDIHGVFIDLGDNWATELNWKVTTI